MFEKDWMSRLQNSFLATKVTHNEKIIAFDEVCLLIGKQLKARPTGSFHFFGNGGSNAICSHISQDVLNKLQRQSSAYDSTSLLTCQANDYGYENAYLNIAKACIKKEDICIVVSSSGNSLNLINLLRFLNNQKIFSISITGFLETNNINKLRGTAIKIFSPTMHGDYGVTECLHQIILHMIWID